MSAPSAFPPLHTINPTSTHTHTIIALHGRSSQGPEFAKDLLEGRTSRSQTLQEVLPGFKWVFPSSQERHSTVFQDRLDEWFDTYSLTEPSAREELQVEGLRDSVAFLLKLIDGEVAFLGGDPSRVFMVGISQGCATGLLTMLVGKYKLGGFMGLSGWMPFRTQIEEIGKEGSVGSGMRARLDAFFESTIGFESSKMEVCARSCVSTRVLLCHAVDDEVVDVELGRQAGAALRGVGMEVEWREYWDGGHWVNEPLGYDDVVAFLARECLEQ